MAGVKGPISLEAGWRRAKADIVERRTFVRHPFAVDLIEVDLQGWLTKLRDALNDGSHRPRPMDVCDVPKAGGAIRPGSILNLDDAVIYAAYVDSAYGVLYEDIQAKSQRVDYAYQMKPPHDRDGWFTDRFERWKRFDDDSIARLDGGVQWVVVADIAGFYDHIDLSILASHLRATGVEASIVTKLSQLLNAWCMTPSRGIPQGHSASDILAKAYLSTVDHNLRERGYDHLRYVDDFRIFCSTFSQARMAIVELSKLLRLRGLSVQSAKLEVLRADAARSKFEGVQPIISGISRNYRALLMDVLKLEDPYTTLGDAETFLQNVEPTAIPMDIIYKVFDAYFGEDGQKFHKSLFRFVLNRLSKTNDSYAVPRIIHYMIYHPEESEACLEYLVKIDGFAAVDDALFTFIRSAECVYEYQVYQIVDALSRTPYVCSVPLKSLLIETAFDAARPGYLRAAGRRYLLTHGRDPEFERLQASFSADHTDLGQAEIICALRRMERTRRNTFYGRWEGLGEFQKRAVVWVRAQDSRHTRSE